jgi:peptide chain release factor 1
MNTFGDLFEKFRARFQTLASQLSSSGLDHAQRARSQKELSQLKAVLEKHDQVVRLQKELASLQADAHQYQTDSELQQMYAQEFESLTKKIEQENRALDELLFPADHLDDRSVFLEIRAGAGGQEASLFAADLLRMYTNYALKHNWVVSVVDTSMTDLGGYREIVLHIEGKNVYGSLKYESGVHRVQRVPVTETAGRIHTSTATVAVLAEAREVESQINPSDLRIDTYRAGGAGGQHVNKTESAIRITHIPSGLVVTCQDERSQHKNKARAMKMLQSRLLMQQKAKHAQEMGQQRKEQVGTGMRAEKVRTYNFPQNRITDHQVDLTLKKLDMVLEGDLDDIIEALQARERDERHKKPLLLASEE